MVTPFKHANFSIATGLGEGEGGGVATFVTHIESGIGRFLYSLFIKLEKWRKIERGNSENDATPFFLKDENFNFGGFWPEKASKFDL